MFLIKRWRGCFCAMESEKLVRVRKQNQHAGTRSLKVLRSLGESKQQARIEVEQGRQLECPGL